MLVNRENYEFFVMDYLDGKLSARDNELFTRFLNDHPDILEEVMNIGQIRLLPGDFIFPDKDLLKKGIKQESVNISHTEYGDYCIAYLEGDLLPSEINDFEIYLKRYPHKRKELELFRKVYLKPDTSIEFASKSKLKKLTIYQKRIRIISSLSTAAAILILAIIFIQPGFDYFKHLITGRNQLKDFKNEIISGNGSLKDDEIELLNQSSEQDIKEQKNLLTPQHIYTIQPKDEEIVKKIEEIPSEDLIIREKVLLKPVSSIQAYLEMQAHPSPDRLLSIPKRNLITSEEYLTIIEFAGDRLKKDVIQKISVSKEHNLTFWDLAYTGFNGLDKISEGSYALNREIDEKGSVRRIMFETPVIGLSIPLKGNKNPQ